MAGSALRLWHDDVRPAPHGWVWAQNNNDARAILTACEVAEISMDHDLGAIPHGEAGIMARGWAEDDGHKLAVWMVETIHVPPVITVHSWNQAGAERMRAVFERAGYHVVLRPFVPSEHGFS